MSLAPLAELLRHDPIVATIASGGLAPVAVSEAARPLAFAAAAVATRKAPVIVGLPSAAEAERLADALTVFAGPDEVALFPAWETLPFERVSPSPETMGRRMEIMWRIAGSGPEELGGPPRFVVASVRALTQRVVPPSTANAPVVIRRGTTLEGGMDPEGLVEALVALGYRREYQVEHCGEVARRGSIVDVFPSTGRPLRADFFGDEVERLTELDVTDQRSGSELKHAVIYGCRELIADVSVRKRAAELAGTQSWGRDRWEKFAEGLVFDGMESWLPWVADGEHVLGDLAGTSALVVLVDAGRMRVRSSELVEEEADLAGAIAATWGMPPDAEVPKLHLDIDRAVAHDVAGISLVTSVAEGPSMEGLDSRGWGDLVPGDTSGLAARLGVLVKERYRVVLCARGEPSADRMAFALENEGLVVDRGGDVTSVGVHVVVERLDAGFVLPSARLAVLTELDVSGRRRSHRREADHRAPAAAGRAERGSPGGFFTDLAPGDYVVHRHHGVGRYSGMVRRDLGGAMRDYLLVEYRGNDKLYIPSDQLELLTRYGGGETPSLNRLGGSDFQRTREKVRKAVREIAQELVVLYSRRMATEGHSFPPDTPWQGEVEESFPYEETSDQLKAIDAVKADMESSRPMDRIICGDVGFGKTEIALRAAFKAVQDGRQVAVLVPTTLLAQQHYDTFSERLAGYPVRVEMLSRFLTPAQSGDVVRGLADGSVDVVIGTHRLLSSDIAYRDLGLLVVDEEQRFGVSHKEAIKAISTGVDVLTLAATPIPRTLEMGLTGIRDITMLTTPPSGRQPILTYVGPYEERAVVEAIRRELLREGQVFFVHNRVRDIHQVAARLCEMVPEARIAVAHGQMDEASLERVALEFAEHRYDVLCCTTIIESGIDMPTVNTLVVDRADLLGLGQLHQLRGRVGRSGQRAYAYLFHPEDVTMSEEAFERLRTIGEMTELGSGLKIALRDLEIRGAGNLLGRDQSGHIAAVGYDLYVAMVGEALAEIKGEAPPPQVDVSIEVPVDAYLPDSYISRDDVRVEAYRSLASVRSPEEVDGIAEEWRDRYGPLPQPARVLVEVARLRAECIRCGVNEVTVTPGRPGGAFGSRAVARLSPIALKASSIVRLRRLHPDAVYKEAVHRADSSATSASRPERGSAEDGSLVVPLAPGSDPIIFLFELLGVLIPPE